MLGRVVLAGSHDAKAMVGAITDYVARRMIEREHALVSAPVPAAADDSRRIEAGVCGGDVSSGEFRPSMAARTATRPRRQ